MRSTTMSLNTMHDSEQILDKDIEETVDNIPALERQDRLRGGNPVTIRRRLEALLEDKRLRKDLACDEFEEEPDFYYQDLVTELSNHDQKE